MNALIKAAKESNLPNIIRSLRRGVDPNSSDCTGWTALHWASQLGEAGVVCALIAGGANVDCVDSEGITPLAVAVGESHIVLIEQFIKAGADINAKIRAYRNGTVLHLACSWGQLDIVHILVEASPSAINIRDLDRKTPLDFAREGGFSQIANYLITSVK